MIALPDDAVRDNPRLAGRPEGLWTMILAAGGARRFGRHKLLRRIGTESLLGHVVTCAEAVTPGRCIVVLGCGASRLRAGLQRQRAALVLNRRWREGMASSLQAGLRALPPSSTAVLVLLADQYAVQPADLRRLLLAWAREPTRPAAAEFDGRSSAPAVLPRNWFPRVMQLHGDEGARRLLRDDRHGTTRVPMPSARLDLDARHELGAFRGVARRNLGGCSPRLAKARREGYIR
jgi:molybdenum cofactor cytidylyltransferase